MGINSVHLHGPTRSAAAAACGPPPAAPSQPPLCHPPAPRCAAQLAESEQQYAEIFDEYEKAREFYAGIEDATHKAQQVGGSQCGRWCTGDGGVCAMQSTWVHAASQCRPVAPWPACCAADPAPPSSPYSQDYLRDQRQWKEASASTAQRIAELEQQLAAERAGRDAAEAQLAMLQDRVQQLEGELSGVREELATARREREAALAAESAALQRQEASAQAQAQAEERCLQHAEERERAEQEAAKARVDAQRCARAGLGMVEAGELQGGCRQLRCATRHQPPPCCCVCRSHPCTLLARCSKTDASSRKFRELEKREAALGKREAAADKAEAAAAERSAKLEEREAAAGVREASVAGACWARWGGE